EPQGRPRVLPAYRGEAWTGRADKRGGSRKGSPGSPRRLNPFCCKGLNLVNLRVNLQIQGSPGGPRFTPTRDVRVLKQTRTSRRPVARMDLSGADPLREWPRGE